MEERLRATKDEIQAARIEVQALESAGLSPDPLVKKLAEAEEHAAEGASTPAAHGDLVLFSRRGRSRQSAVPRYEAEEIRSALARASEERLTEREESRIEAAGAIGQAGVSMAEAIARTRDAVIARGGDALTIKEIDRITQQVEAEIARLTVKSMRRIQEE